MPEPADASAALRTVASALAEAGVSEYAVTGALALGVWALPRVARELELVGEMGPEAQERLLASYDGVRAGADDAPVLHFRVEGWDVEFLAAADDYLRACLARAETAELHGLRVRVATAEDVVVQKLYRLRATRRGVLQELADLRALFEARGDALDAAYLRRWLKRGEISLVFAVATLDEENLVARLFAP